MSDLFDAKTLGEFKKEHLIKIIMELQKEKSTLIEQQNSISAIKDRVTELERSHFLYMQYGRRESIEIVGIPQQVEQESLEEEVLKIYEEAKVQIDGRKLSSMDISACHRVGKKGATIVRFVNRKFAKEGLYKGKNLKGTKLYNGSAIYINNSFCYEYKQYGWVIRTLKKNGLISGFKVKNGVHHIKLLSSDAFVEISHRSDFSKYNLDVSSFF